MNRHQPATAVVDRERRGTLASMCLALVLVVASVSSVNLALTGISVDLGTSSSQLTWIADGYTVALAALVLPFGALGDRFGRRTLLLAGTVLFGLAALAAAAAQAPELLIACRVAMGIGAAMIMPGTLSTITAVFPPEQRGRAVSVWAGLPPRAPSSACWAAGSSSSGARGGRPSSPRRSSPRRPSSQP